jgi:hypothetical protein
LRVLAVEHHAAVLVLLAQVQLGAASEAVWTSLEAAAGPGGRLAPARVAVLDRAVRLAASLVAADAAQPPVN